jgi:hypothetical protein
MGTPRTSIACELWDIFKFSTLDARDAMATATRFDGQMLIDLVKRQ